MTFCSALFHFWKHCDKRTNLSDQRICQQQVKIFSLHTTLMHIDGLTFKSSAVCTKFYEDGNHLIETLC